LYSCFFGELLKIYPNIIKLEKIFAISEKLMSDEETINKFLERIEMFTKGFEAITKNLNESLEKMSKDAAKLAENTNFLPKILTSNKEIKKSTENLTLIITTLLARLERVGGA
jgi:hypothetical protein